MSYKFSKIDSIKEKKLYMYSNYKGLKFLNDYLKCRKNDIQKILRKIKKKKNFLESNITNYTYLENESIKKNIEDLISLIIPKIEHVKNKRNFELNDISHDIELLFNQFIKNKKINMYVLNKLIKKYEVKKILRVQEKDNSSNNKKVEIEEIYHLIFSVILTLTFLSNINLLKTFNTLLKINDLQIYRFYKEKFFHIDILLYLLIIEIKLFKNLKLKFLGN